MRAVGSKFNSSIHLRLTVLASLLCLFLPLALLSCQSNNNQEERLRIYYTWRLSDFARQFVMDVEFVEIENEHTQFILTPTEYTYIVIDELNYAIRTLMEEGRMIYREGVGLVIPISATGDPEDVVFESLSYPLTMEDLCANRFIVQDLFGDMWIRPLRSNLGADLDRPDVIREYMQRQRG